LPVEFVIKITSFRGKKTVNGINPTHKSPSYDPIITDIYTSVYGRIIPVYSIACSGKVQIGEFRGFGRPMWANEDIFIWDAGDGNELKFKFYEAGCLLEVGIIKERWVTRAM